MSGSWKLGKICGIDVQVHWTFVLLPAAVLLMSLAAGHALSSAVASVLFLLAVFACVVLHELGHALAARYYGIGTRDITLLPIGGVARLERLPEKPSQEIVVALAGPAVNVAIAVTLFAGMLALNTAPALLVQLFWANVVLLAFNLLPAFPMDGGRVLRALVAMHLPHSQATSIAAAVGRSIAIGLGIFGLFFNWMLVFVAIFIYYAAGSEERFAVRKTELDRLKVGALMKRRFQAIPADVRLRDVASVLDFNQQRTFPVVHGRRLLGVVHAEDLQQHAAAGAGAVRAVDAMRTDVQPLLEHESLGTADDLATGKEFPVVRGGELVGWLSADGLPAVPNEGESIDQKFPWHTRTARTANSAVS